MKLNFAFTYSYNGAFRDDRRIDGRFVSLGSIAYIHKTTFALELSLCLFKTHTLRGGMEI